MAAAPKSLKTLAGQTLKAAEIASTPPATPVDPFVMAQTILQLQNTVNELIVRHNALCVATTNAGDEVTGTAQAASNLFTNS